MSFTPRLFRVTSCLILLCFLPAIAVGVRAAEGEPSPVGLWKTLDDRTHMPRAIIRIYEEKGAFFGKIEYSFDPEERTARCEKCSGDRRDAPVIGLIIMRGVTKHGSEYRGGEILDPETGWVYRCRFTISADGEKLFVRGYLGLAVLGRTQIWTRTAGNEIAAD